MDHLKLRKYQSEYLRKSRKNTFFIQFKKTTIFVFFLGLIMFGIYEYIEIPKPIIESKDLVLLKKKRPNLFSILYKRGYPIFDKIENGRYVEYFDGVKVIYTVLPELQQHVNSIFAKFKVPYGSFVALDPSTGRIISYVEYTKYNKSVRGFNLKATYPAASLFKIITASAVIDEGLLSRSSVISFSGNPYRLNKSKIKNNRRRDKNISTLENALGKSNNVVFGKIGVNILGDKTLLEYSEKFLFNKKIKFDFPLERSTAHIPSEPYKLAKVSAGFTGVNISPIHASLLAGAISENGNMLKPILIDRIIGRDGNVIFESEPKILKQVITKSAAIEIKKMMLKTILSGTGSTTFRKYAKKLVSNIKIGGKTGTLNGKTPKGLYDWFVGFAPFDIPEIAISALIINQPIWHIKATYIAQSAFKKYFKYN